MGALSQDRNTPSREGVITSHDVAATTKIYGGSIVMLDSSGNAAPATAASGLICAGCAEEQVDNSSGSAGDLKVKVRKGTRRFANGASITKADIGDLAFALDDQTVGKTGTSRSAVGRIVDVDSDGVWVDMDDVVAPDSANADTSGNNAAQNETEINEIKATLRKHGLIAQA